MIDRRTFLVATAGALLAAPLAAGAQPAPRNARIGYLATNLATTPTYKTPSAKDCVTSVTSRVATS